MNINKLQPIVIGVVITIITIVIMKWLFSVIWLWTLLASFILGVVVTVSLVARSRGERPQDLAEEVIQQVVNPDPDALKHRVEEQLVLLNEKLRLEVPSKVVIEVGEEVIDLLIQIVPRALADSPNSEATFNLEKLATDYFPDLVKDYLELSSEDKANKESSLLDQLKDIKKIAHAAKASLDEGNLDEFQISSSFLKAKHA